MFLCHLDHKLYITKGYRDKLFLFVNNIQDKQMSCKQVVIFDMVIFNITGTRFSSEGLWVQIPVDMAKCN